MGAIASIMVTTSWYLSRSLGIASPTPITVESQPDLPSQPIVSVRQLGLVVHPLSGELVAKHKLGDEQGVIVGEVIPNTPGAEAGLQVGDVILVLGNRRVASDIDLEEATRTMNPGTRKPLEIVRDGFRMTLHLKVDSPRD